LVLPLGSDKARPGLLISSCFKKKLWGPTESTWPKIHSQPYKTWDETLAYGDLFLSLEPLPACVPPFLCSDGRGASVVAPVIELLRIVRLGVAGSRWMPMCWQLHVQAEAAAGRG